MNAILSWWDGVELWLTGLPFILQVVIVMPPTHQEIAIMINASRETVTRAFQTLGLHDVIQRNGNTLHLTKPSFLADVGEGRMEPPKA